MVILFVGLLYVFSVALVSPKSANRMFAPRVCVMAAWAISGAVSAAWGGYESSEAPIVGWFVVATCLFTGLLIPVLGERDAWGLRVRREIPRDWIGRPVAFVFYTGSAGGVVWCVAMVLATIFCAGAAQNCVSTPHTQFGEPSRWPWVTLFGFVLCCCLTVTSLRTTLLKTVPTVTLPFFAVGVGVAAWVLPCLVAFFAGADERAISECLAFPLGLMRNEARFGPLDPSPIVWVWLAAGLAGSIPWLNQQWVRFVPYPEVESEVQETHQDHGRLGPGRAGPVARERIAVLPKAVDRRSSVILRCAQNDRLPSLY